MKQSKLVVLVSALLCGVAAGTTSATVVTVDQPVAAILPASALGVVLAKHGADDAAPEPCDDHGTDLCVSGGQALAKHGGAPVQALDRLAREAGEGPRGGDNERAGDRQRGRRLMSEDLDRLAREAGEGPRGGNNERPGDRQRRGG